MEKLVARVPEQRLARGDVCKKLVTDESNAPD